jgi:nucleotide-binding universal stress UspA family protein
MSNPGWRRRSCGVGVDGPLGSLHALAWATAEARVRNGTLEVVAAWTHPPPVLLVRVAPDTPPVDTLSREAHDMIERALEKVAEAVAGLDIERGSWKATLRGLPRARKGEQMFSSSTVTASAASVAWCSPR